MPVKQVKEVVADRELWLTADLREVVEAGDKRAISCLVRKGDLVGAEAQLLYGFKLEGKKLKASRELDGKWRETDDFDPNTNAKARAELLRLQA